MTHPADSLEILARVIGTQAELITEQDNIVSLSIKQFYELVEKIQEFKKFDPLDKKTWPDENGRYVVLIKYNGAHCRTWEDGSWNLDNEAITNWKNI